MTEHPDSNVPEPEIDLPPESPEPPPPPPPPPEPAPLPSARAALNREIERDVIAGGGQASAQELRTNIRAIPAGIAPAGAFRRVSFDLWLRFSDYAAAYNAHNGEQLSMHFSALAENPGNDMTVDEGIAAATALLSPPADAVLEMAEYDNAAGEPFFVAIWRHVHNAVPVERDQIVALINGRSRRIFNWQRKWHTVNTIAGPR